MALDTYSDLVTALGLWLKGSPFAGQEETFIALTTDEINARLAVALDGGARIRPMIDRDNITINAEYVALPDSNSDMILPLSMEVTSLSDKWQIDYIAPEQMVSLQYGVDAARDAIDQVITGNPPRYYTVVGGNFRFFPAPQSPDSFTAEFIRYVKVPDINTNVVSNWVLANHRNAYLYGALAQAEMFGWNDPRMASLTQLFALAVEGIVARYPSPVDMSDRRSEVALLSRNGLTYAAFMSGNV